MSSILDVSGVSKTFRTAHGDVNAVQDVSVSVNPGETVAIIGESGSGKTTLARIALGLTTPDRGDVRFRGSGWHDGSAEDRRHRRADISVVFQEPGASLDPRQTIGASILEPLRLHRSEMDAAGMKRLAMASMEQAHLPTKLFNCLPRELSGGEQQRACVARAIATEPSFIVLDEPTAALDASIRADLLETLREIQSRLSISYLLISHDMATIAEMSHHVHVMYRGVVVEQGATESVLTDPQHPYTASLLSAVLTAFPSQNRPQLRLTGAPRFRSADEGCVLYGRCHIGDAGCVGTRIPLVDVPTDHHHQVSCVKPGQSFAEEVQR